MADFDRYDAQVVGISVDSIPSHVAFAKSLGGIEKYPLLGDFHPKGEVSKRYGVWKDDAGHCEPVVLVVGLHGGPRSADPGDDNGAPIMVLSRNASVILTSGRRG